MFPTKIRFLDKASDLLLLQNVIVATERKVLGQSLNRGNKPDEYHFGIDAYLFSGAGIVMAGKNEILMKFLIQEPDGIQEPLEIRSEVPVSIFKERGMDAGVASPTEERIVLLDRHALGRVSGQKPAGNQIKPAPEEQ